MDVIQILNIGKVKFKQYLNTLMLRFSLKF